MGISRRYIVCNIDTRRASYANYLRIKRHLENLGQDAIIIPHWLFKEEQEPNKN